MEHCNCGLGVRWCARADALFDVPDMHVLDVVREPERLVLTVETDTAINDCPACGVVAVGTAAGSTGSMTRPASPFRPWWCGASGSGDAPSRRARWGRFSESHPLAGARAKLTRRAVGWAVDALGHDDTTVSALARHLGVDWHTLWDAAKVEARARLGDPDRLSGVVTLGVDEHIWRPSHRGRERAVTTMVDLTRDAQGCMRARLLDVVPGRSGTAYAAWLKARPPGFTTDVKQAALDPFRGYANAIRDELPDAVAVLDAFHVVRLGTQVVDEVRRRVQQDTLGHRGHKDDPLYRVRGLLRRGAEHLTARQVARLDAALLAGDPDWEVTIAWSCYQQLRSIYHARTPADGRKTAEHVIRSFPGCPIPEVARLGRTLRSWRSQVLAHFDTGGVSNGGTEAINLLIEKTRRTAHGFRSFANYRLRILLAASGTRAYRPAATHG